MGALDRIFRRRQGQQRPLESYVRGLFAAGEQGVWYDIPGHADVLNQLGPELLTNGDFSAGTTGWTLGAGYTVESGVLKGATASNQTAAQDMPIVAGRWYIVSLDVLSYTSGNIRVNVGGNVVSVFNPVTLGSRKVLVQAGANYARVLLYAGDVSVGGTSSFDNISVREWVGASSCALYQDAAGTTPVYMPGQGQIDPPVGLLLDKRLGLARGPELVSNGDFATDTWWSKDTGVAITGGACVFSAVTTSRGVYRSSLTQVGKCYVVTYTVVVNSGAIRPLIAGSFGVSRTTSGTYTEVLSGTSGALFGLFANPSFDGAVDNVSLREVLGNHAFQATTTSRPTLSARYNLLTATEFANGLTDAPSRAGLISATALAGYAGAVAFGYDGATTSYAYKNDIGSYPLATVSVVVQMDDGNAPMFGATSSASNTDFALVVRNAAINPSTYLVTPLPNGCYMVSGSQVATSGSSAVGVVKYNSNSPRTFKVTAFDLRPANDGVGLPPYQRVLDANTYDTVGFPLYLKFDGVDDWMQTANVDFSGTDVVAIATAYRKMSDVSVGEVFALSGSPTANAGTFGFYAPETGGGTVAAVFFARGASSIISGQRLGTAPISCVAGGWASLSMPYMQYRINQGVSLTSSVATGGGNYGNYPLFIGRRNGTSFPFNGRLYGLIIRGAATPDPTISRVERYLNSKARAY